MPIYFRKPDNALVAHFGVGDVGIAVGRDDTAKKWNQIILFQGEPGEIGRLEQFTEITTDKLRGSIISLYFDSIDSLTVLIEQAEALREKMKGNQ